MEVAVTVVDVESILEGVVRPRESGAASTHHVEIGIAIAVRVEEHGVDVSKAAFAEEGLLDALLERPVALLDEESARLTSTPAHIEILETIAIHVGHRDGRPSSGHRVWQQRL